MDTALEQSLRSQFPDIYPFATVVNEEHEYCTKYVVLRHFGEYCSTHFDDNRSQCIIETINSFYQSKDMFLRNAIENEFLQAIAQNLETNNLMTYLTKLPVDLQLSYIKVLLETMKHKDRISHV